MSVLSIKDVVKRFGNHAAVDGATFEVPQGSIFGLLGPNGAGKTTLLRIITTIMGADEGEIKINGEKLNTRHISEIGYLPEERGLYKKMKVGDQLLFLAQLKGLNHKEARKKIKTWFEKFEIGDWWNKKVQELSKGMQQKIQFIATVVHEPKLLILDEPFSGLDPINTNLIKDEIHRLNKEGTSIIFSTHRMEQVEEICTDIVLINKGKVILDGKMTAIKEDHKENIFQIGTKDKLPLKLRNGKFEIIAESESGITVHMTGKMTSNDLLSTLIRNSITIDSYNEIKPTLNEIFIKLVGESNE